MSVDQFGSHSSLYAHTINSTKTNTPPSQNNLTRRNAQILQRMPNRAPSSSLASANIKALRLFRYVCRMLPIILKTHQILHKVTSIQAKRHIANTFRTYSTETNLVVIDNLIQHGYQVTHQAEWQFSNTGYLYQFLFSKNLVLRNMGKSHIKEARGENEKRGPATSFLKSFYLGKKSHTS